MERSERPAKLLKYLYEIERLLDKYNVTSQLPEVSECVALMAAGMYQDVISRINSPKWWGGDYAVSDVYLTSTNKDEIPRDMAIFESNLFRIACILEDEGIQNEDAHEVIFRLSSWGYKVE